MSWFSSSQCLFTGQFSFNRFLCSVLCTQLNPTGRDPVTVHHSLTTQCSQTFFFREGNMSGSQGSARILCPVTGCPEASTSSSRHFRNFASIRPHLNDHCTGQLTGAIPAGFLNHHNFTQCNVCDKIISKVYYGTCPRCRPSNRTRVQINSIRTRINTPGNNNTTSQSTSSANQVEAPSLSTVHTQYVRTIRNIPMSCRSKWALCFTRAVAQAVWLNNEVAWTELQMLANCTLCSPPRGGKSHKAKG